MNVKLPNGKVIKGVPDGTPKDVVAQKAIAAGYATEQDFPELFQDSANFQNMGEDRSLADQFTGESRMTDQIKSMEEIGSAPELNELSVPAFKASLGLLTTGDIESLKGVLSEQMGDKVNFSEDEKGNTVVNLPSGSYALNKPGLSGQDVIRGLFDFAAFTPAGRASSIGGAALKSGFTQTGMDLAEQSLGGEDIALDESLEAAAFGGLGKGLEKVLGGAWRALRGQKSEPVEQVMGFAKEQDVPLMTTDIAQPETFSGKLAQSMGEKIPLAGTGGERAMQQKARSELVEKTKEMFGDYSPETVYKSLVEHTSKVKQAAGQRLGRISDELGLKPAVNRTTGKIDEIIESLTVSPGGQKKTVVDNETVKALTAFKEDLINDPSFKSLEQIRTAFREGVKGERMALPTQTKAKLDAVYESMTDDMFNAVKENMGDQAAQKWKAANRIYAEQANTIKKTRLKAALEKGDVTPEIVNNMLFSQKTSEAAALYKSLNNQGRQSARAGLIAKAAEKAAYSPDRFLTELNKMEKKTGIFFKGDDKRFINGLRAYLSATKRAGTAGVMTETGQQVAGALPIAAAASGPQGLAAAATFGGMARVYESAPIRNLMASLSGTPRGSTQFENTLAAINALAAPAVQATRED